MKHPDPFTVALLKCQEIILECEMTLIERLTVLISATATPIETHRLAAYFASRDTGYIQEYPCGCSAAGPTPLPGYCPEHGKRMNCPNCQHPIEDSAVLAEAGRIRAGQRTTHSGGRKRKPRVRRCGCGKMTLRRAKLRGKEKAHEPGCEYYPKGEGY